MSAMGLLTGTQEHSHGGLPTLPLVNLFAEKALTEPSGFALIGRPGLQKYFTTARGGAVAIRAIHYDEGLSAFAYVYSTTFDVAGDTTTLSGSLVPSIASNQMGIIATAGGAAKYFDGSAPFRSIAFPDSANVTKVAENQGRFLFLRAGSHRLYWTEPLANMLDGSGDIVIDGLAYVSAENEPDYAVDMVVWQDRLAIGGTRTIEIFTPTGTETAAYAPLTGTAVQRGVFATGAMCVWDNQLCWVSPERAIWRWPGNQEDKLSNAGIEEKLRSYTGISLTSFHFDGREFLHVFENDGSGTPSGAGAADLLLDASTGEWCEWETDGVAFDGGPSTAVPDTDYPVFGGKTDSVVLGISYYQQLAGGDWEDATEHRFRAGIPIDGGAIPIHNVLLRCSSYASPGGESVSLRYSRDKGQTWSSWLERDISNPLRKKVEWRALPMADAPGFLCEFKTAGVDASRGQFYVSGVYYNEFVAGRGRT